jgi:hypothetical protein
LISINEIDRAAGDQGLPQAAHGSLPKSPSGVGRLADLDQCGQQNGALSFRLKAIGGTASRIGQTQLDDGARLLLEKETLTREELPLLDIPLPAVAARRV